MFRIFMMIIMNSTSCYNYYICMFPNIKIVVYNIFNPTFGYNYRNMYKFKFCVFFYNYIYSRFIFFGNNIYIFCYFSFDSFSGLFLYYMHHFELFPTRLILVLVGIRLIYPFLLSFLSWLYFRYINTMHNFSSFLLKPLGRRKICLYNCYFFNLQQVTFLHKSFFKISLLFPIFSIFPFFIKITSSAIFKILS